MEAILYLNTHKQRYFLVLPIRKVFLSLLYQNLLPDVDTHRHSPWVSTSVIICKNYSRKITKQQKIPNKELRDHDGKLIKECLFLLYSMVLLTINFAEDRYLQAQRKGEFGVNGEI